MLLSSKIIVALDFSCLQQARSFVEQLEPAWCRLKVGSQMYTRFGPQWVTLLIQKGFDVFLDLKYLDIPKTVAHAVAAAADLGVWMLNVHACGGQRMLDAARQALESFGRQRPLLIAVTALTSFSQSELHQLGWSGRLEDYVLALSKITNEQGLDGVVASAHEVPLIRQEIGVEFLVVTPGIRLPNQHISADDQRRILSPREALASGSDYLVMGRSLTQASEPILLLHQLNQMIATETTAL